MYDTNLTRYQWNSFCFQKLRVYSFKNSFKLKLNFNIKSTIYSHNSIKIKKFQVIKAPFKYNKSKEQFFFKTFFFYFKLFNMSPKIYEIILLNYIYFSNLKNLKMTKIEYNKNFYLNI